MTGLGKWSKRPSRTTKGTWDNNPKMIFRRRIVSFGMWTACICFRIRYSCELTGTQIWKFKFHNRPGIWLLHWPIITFSRRTHLHGVGHMTVEALPQYEMEAGIPSRCNNNNLLISKISSTCFRQSFAHLQERNTEIYSIWYSVLLLW